MRSLKILIIVTNIRKYSGETLDTGLWLSELIHIYHAAKEKGYEIIIASPNGGQVPVDPESLKRFTLDKISKEYWNDPSFRELLKNSTGLAKVSDQQFDLVYLAGGHGTMYDFPNDTTMQAIVRHQYESGKIVATICRGVGGLLNVKLSTGEYLIKGKKITGQNPFSSKEMAKVVMQELRKKENK